MEASEDMTPATPLAQPFLPCRFVCLLFAHPFFFTPLFDLYGQFRSVHHLDPDRILLTVVRQEFGRLPERPVVPLENVRRQMWRQLLSRCLFYFMSLNHFRQPVCVMPLHREQT